MSQDQDQPDSREGLGRAYSGSPTRLSGSHTFQHRVGGWMAQCFPPEVSEDLVERCDRFTEEALELVQAFGYGPERAHALVDYVFGRDVGDPPQEVGGVMVTLAALCNTAKLHMMAAGEDELARILRPEIILKIRAKQAAKPTGSALPSTVSESSGDGQAPGITETSNSGGVL